MKRPLLLSLALLPMAAAADLIVMDESSDVRLAAPMVRIQPVKPALPAWEVRSGAHLRATLDEWAMRSGWSFVWGLPADADFRFGAGNTYVGEFKSAVTDLINSLPPTVRIRVELRPDNMPPLLYVTSQGEGK